MTNWKRWGYLMVGTVMMLLLGLIYAWSIFVTPLETEFGWSRAQTSLTFTVCMSFFVLGLMASGFLSKRWSPRVTMLLAAAFLLAGFGLCSRINSLPGLYGTYGVLIGFAVGLGNNALVSTLVKWFPGRTGVASGFLMMGFGVGGMVLGSLAAGLMREIGWRGTFLAFGICFAAVIALGSLVVRLPPQEQQPAAGGPVKLAQNPDMPASQVVRRPSFWLYIVWFAMIMGGGLMVIGHAATFAAELGASVSVAAALTGLLSLSNGLGRVLIGIVFDKLGLRRSMLLTTCYLLAAALLLLAANQTRSIVLVALGFVLTGLCYGGGATTSSTFSSSFYGMKHFAMNYGIVSIGVIPGALFGPYLAGVLRTGSGGYFTSLITMLCFGLVALVFRRLIRTP